MAVILWIVLVMTALYLLQRIFFSIFGFKALSYTRSFSSTRVHAGQTVWMRETIANRKRLPLPWLRVESMLPAQLVFKHREADMSINRGDRLQNHASLFSIPSYTEIVRKHEIACPFRGKYRVTSYTLSMGDLVGLSGKSIQQQGNCEVVVYPALKEIREFPLGARKYLQSVRSMISPIMENHHHVAGIRPYREGDSFRMVNWSATAKTGNLLVHKRESMQDNDLTIILNAELLDSAHNARITSEEFEGALSYAASAAQYVISGGGKAGFIFNGANDGAENSIFRAPARAGSAHMDMLLEAMAGFRPVTALGLSFLLEQLVAERTRGMNYFLITGFIDGKQEQLVSKLRGQGNTVQLLLLGKGAVA
ncbi:DUF58 domain-containing protein [Cohnella terricola]|uniref:DUF58 domain-containing protein n=1 Tax=Cohnella terricola TaxID=1289167 RepID=A0A559JAE5_9BACL|nr:DUF58 domain-containing protein [Cohnella terricola]TVX96858.1 DUF58 domain-containing protein [Cohnella terricola]